MSHDHIMDLDASLEIFEEFQAEHATSREVVKETEEVENEVFALDIAQLAARELEREDTARDPALAAASATTAPDAEVAPEADQAEENEPTTAADEANKHTVDSTDEPEHEHGAEVVNTSALRTAVRPSTNPVRSPTSSCSTSLLVSSMLLPLTETTPTVLVPVHQSRYHYHLVLESM